MTIGASPGTILTGLLPAAQAIPRRQKEHMLDTGRDRRAAAFVETGPLLSLQATFARRAWRIGPAWAVLAGVLASGAPFLAGDAPLRLAGAIALADPAWGLLWRLTACGSDHATQSANEVAGLPFGQPDAPLARVLRRLRHMSSAAAWHELPMALVLAVGLSVLLGPNALALTLAACAVLFVAWLTAERDGQPALAFALLSVGLPWGLGALLAGGWADGWERHLALAASFTALQWGVQRACLDDRGRAWGLWLGQAAVLLALVTLQRPWALATIAVPLLCTENRQIRMTIATGTT